MNLEKLVAECGVKLYDVEIANENGRAIYRIYITKENGVTLDDCEKVSRLLSPIYDVKAPLNGEYVLEVSSPGLERKLTKPEHFKASLNELVRIKLNDKSVLEGKLLAAEEDKIILELEEEEKEISLSDIKSARTYIIW